MSRVDVSSRIAQQLQESTARCMEAAALAAEGLNRSVQQVSKNLAAYKRTRERQELEDAIKRYDRMRRLHG